MKFLLFILFFLSHPVFASDACLDIFTEFLKLSPPDRQNDGRIMLGIGGAGAVYRNTDGSTLKIYINPNEAQADIKAQNKTAYILNLGNNFRVAKYTATRRKKEVSVESFTGVMLQDAIDQLEKQGMSEEIAILKRKYSGLVANIRQSLDEKYIKFEFSITHVSEVESLPSYTFKITDAPLFDPHIVTDDQFCIYPQNILLSPNTATGELDFVIIDPN